MKRHIVNAAMFLAVLPVAFAHSPEHTQLHEQFYRHLLRPDIPNPQPGSCCGGMDCYPTTAEVRGGQWWALRREDKTWIEIPSERVIRDENSPDGRAHLCATIDYTYCFVPPPSGA